MTEKENQVDASHTTTKSALKTMYLPDSDGKLTGLLLAAMNLFGIVRKGDREPVERRGRVKKGASRTDSETTDVRRKRVNFRIALVEYKS